MDQIVSVQPRGGVSKAAKMVGLILTGTIAAALIIGWVALLIWFAGEAVVNVVHWLWGQS